MSRFRIEDLLDAPWQSPEDVPVFVALCLLPAALLKVLDKRTLIEISLPFKLELGLLVVIAIIIIVEDTVCDALVVICRH